MDVGCEYCFYVCDVMRIMFLNKKNLGYWLSKEVENIYKFVEKM